LCEKSWEIGFRVGSGKIPRCLKQFSKEKAHSSTVVDGITVKLSNGEKLERKK